MRRFKCGAERTEATDLLIFRMDDKVGRVLRTDNRDRASHAMAFPPAAAGKRADDEAVILGATSSANTGRDEQKCGKMQLRRAYTPVQAANQTGRAPRSTSSATPLCRMSSLSTTFEASLAYSLRSGERPLLFYVSSHLLLRQIT
jgi:hypothetical protein